MQSRLWPCDSSRPNFDHLRRELCQDVLASANAAFVHSEIGRRSSWASAAKIRNWKAVALNISAQTNPMPCSRILARKLTPRERRSRHAMTIFALSRFAPRPEQMDRTRSSVTLRSGKHFRLDDSACLHLGLRAQFVGGDNEV